MNKNDLAKQLDELVSGIELTRKVFTINTTKKIVKYLECDKPDDSMVLETASLCWKLKKWAIKNNQVEIEICLNKILGILESEGVEIIDYTGRKYDISFNITIINWEDISENCIISEMNQPFIIKGNTYLDGEGYIEDISEDSIVTGICTNTKEKKCSNWNKRNRKKNKLKKRRRKYEKIL